MWCVPTLDQNYTARMEDVMEVLSRSSDERARVVALDERPVTAALSLINVQCVRGEITPNCGS
jgi:hypothetical protein